MAPEPRQTPAEGLLTAVRHVGSEEPVKRLLSAAHVAAEVDRLGALGVNALGLAVWRNHAGLVEALLDAGADPGLPDCESGWTPLHRALHWGQLRIAAALLRANASLAAPDWRGRSPLDLLSAELKVYLEPGEGDVFSWGNGNNYTLGTGSTDVQLHPARVESLHDQQIVAISAAKFHSAAVSVDGRLLTWGWGRGGRLGHPEAHVHSGEGAVIAPLWVSGLGKRQVAAVAAGKHHTVLCTTAGEVWTCGSNRHGQLGYAVDSQPTPRRVSSLRQRVVAVAAANKHSVAVTAGGDVYTWGCNVLGQLGYGTSDSSSNAAPRLVEAMRGKPVVAAAAAKRHTLVLTAGGEVYTWGHRGVSPRRVQLAGSRDALSLLGAPISFHRGHSDVTRPLARAICAGAAHSSALTDTGVVLCWRSADPALQVQEVGGALAGRRVVSVAAGKYRTAAVDDEGNVYMWEGRSDYFPAEGRQPGSGSKKPAGGSSSRARPIPSRASGGGGGGTGGRTSLAGEASAGSYGSAEVNGGSYGSNSHSRRPGSWIERFARERESGAGALSFGPSSFGAGAGSLGRGDMLGSMPAGAAAGGGSASKSRASDTFERIHPERVDSLKRAVAVAVGEKHSLAVQRWSAVHLEGMAAVPWLQVEPAAAGARASASAASLLEEEAWYQQAADALDDAASLASPRDLEAEPSAASTAATWPEHGQAAGLLSPGGRPLASPVRPSPHRARSTGAAVGVPSLQRICEEEVARRLVDPRTCLQVLEYADVAGAEVLRAYCLSVAACNLDAVLLEAGGAFEELPPHLLAELEHIFKLRLAGASAASGSAASGGGAGGSMAGGASRGLDSSLQAAEPAGPEASTKAAVRPGSLLQPGRRPTAAAPWLGDEGWEMWEGLAPGMSPPLLHPSLSSASGSSFRDRGQADAEAASQRLQRTLQKKLQQIEHLAAKAAGGEVLDAQQRGKLESRPVIQSALAALEGGMAVDDVQAILRAAAAGREPDAEAAAAGGACGAPGSSSKASASKAGKGKRGSAVKAPPPAAEPAAPAADDAAAAAAAAVAAAALAEAALAGTDSSELLGSSPPASSLVPAFGLAGPAASASPASGPPVRVRSQVGFAAAGDSDGWPAGSSHQAALGSRGASSAGRPKSATKRKGGLSMFLRGELEQGPSQGPAPVASADGDSGASTGTAAPTPAWGARAAAPQAGATSLKQILDQEAAVAGKAPSSAPQQRATPGSGIKSRPAVESPAAATPSGGTPAPAAAAGSSSGGAPLRLSLASFMQTSPMAMQRGGLAGAGPDRGASPPPAAWGGASGASPPAAKQTSFRAIQEEQEAQHVPTTKLHGTSPPIVQRLSSGLPPWRPPAPPAASAGAAGASLLGTSPSASGSLLGTSPSGRGSSFLAAPVPQHSKWYIPEESRADLRKSLKSIQTEEEAMAELSARGFGGVRVVPKTERRPPSGLPRPAAGKQQGGGGGGGAGAGGRQEVEEAGQQPGEPALPQQQQRQGEGRRAHAGPPAPRRQDKPAGEGEAAPAGQQQRPRQQGRPHRRPGGERKSPQEGAPGPGQQEGEGQQQQRRARRPAQPKEGQGRQPRGEGGQQGPPRQPKDPSAQRPQQHKRQQAPPSGQQQEGQGRPPPGQQQRRQRPRRPPEAGQPPAAAAGPAQPVVAAQT